MGLNVYFPADVGVVRLPTFVPLDPALLPTCFANHGRPVAPHDATGNLWNTPSDCQVCRCMSTPYDEAHFWITIHVICESLHNNSRLDDIDPILASAPIELFHNAV